MNATEIVMKLNETNALEHTIRVWGVIISVIIMFLCLVFSAILRNPIPFSGSFIIALLISIIIAIATGPKSKPYKEIILNAAENQVLIIYKNKVLDYELLMGYSDEIVWPYIAIDSKNGDIVINNNLEKATYNSGWIIENQNILEKCIR